MGEIADVVQEQVEKAKESRLNSYIALIVSIAATLMALGNVKDGNIVQAMQQAQASAVDTWSYYQAKSTKQNIAEATADQMALQRDTTPNLAPEARALYDKRIAEYKDHAKKYETEKADIKKQAEDYAATYDKLNFTDDQFDMAEACLSIAIALLGITALTQKRWLFVFGCVLAGLGCLFSLSAFVGLKIHPDFLAKLLS
jgi:Domain of unknown function (DUF4337)